MDNQPPRSQAALRRLIAVIVVAICVVIYAYGWEVTDISLEPTQDATRQASVGRAMRELLSPNIFSQDRESETVGTAIIYDCAEGEAPQPAASDAHYIIVTPACGVRDQRVLVEGFNFAANADGLIRWIPETGQPRPLGNTLTDGNGYFSMEIRVPSIRGTEPGSVQTIEAEISWPVGTPRLSNTTNLVVEKIIETIFLALMATTVALPIAVVLSFLAAHNLMKPIKMPIGNALIGFALLPVGYFVGERVLGAIGTLGVDLGSGVIFGVGASAILIFASITASHTFGRLNLEGSAAQARSILTSAAVLVLGIFVLGVIGGLSIWLGSILTSGVLGYLGNFIGTLGQLIELTIAAIGGIAGAFFLSGLGMRGMASGMRLLGEIEGRVVGGVLGAISGAFLMAGTASIGTQVALMTLLTPLFAAVLSATLPAMIYDRIFNKTSPLSRTPTDRLIRNLLGWAMFAVVFFYTYTTLNVGRSVIDGRLAVGEIFIPSAAILGAVLGAAAGLLSGIHGPMPMGSLVYNVTRTVLNALRSIEPLIMGIVFVIWVGVGPFAGVLALTLHSIASLGKLYSEQIENIDEGPIEAIQATGATRLQTIIYAVVPQIVPPYIAFTLYRWDINVRMSTIIGFVGGGGIGFLLQQQINLLRYREAGVAVLAIAIVVSILDYASATIREKLV
jgi:phosphonate ABC transporter permease subunit PhnE